MLPMTDYIVIIIITGGVVETLNCFALLEIALLLILDGRNHYPYLIFFINLSSSH